MNARKLQPQEFWRGGLNMAVAFESPFEFEKEREKSQSAQPSANEDYYGAFLQEDQPPVASLIINHKQSRFDGHVVKMGGVGGVATLPAHRRGGAIRTMMYAALRDMYDNGYALSHLYPFSTAYYRQFGFAAAGRTLRWRVKLRDLERLPRGGGAVRQLFPGESLAPLLEVYNKMYGDINFSCLRDVFDKDLEGDKALSQKRYIFLWTDDAGVPGGLLVCGRVGQTLHCLPTFPMNNGLLFASPEALIGILNFIHHSFIANFEAVELAVPDHIDLTVLLPELAEMDCKSALNGMARVVNAELLLKLCRCKGQGNITIQVEDTIIGENNGVFRLSFAPGQENQVERVDAAPEVTLDPGSLAVLLGGARNAESLAMTPGITVAGKTAALEQVFYRKPCHVLDLF